MSDVETTSTEVNNSETAVNDTTESSVHRYVDDIDTSTQLPANEDNESGGMDDLFGDDDEEQNDQLDEDDDESVAIKKRDRSNYYDNDEMDEEERDKEMYNRKFYGDDRLHRSDEEDSDYEFKESDVKLVRHVVPHKIRPTSVAEEDEENTHKDLYYAKIPPFLRIDPVPFDSSNFESNVKQRMKDTLTEEEQITDRLRDENTIRWRYSKDDADHVFKQSNAQIIQWSDGSYSLKLGNDYTDILSNDTDNTFLTVSHDQQELMQCVDGGEIKKTLMFIPSSTKSKIHKRLTATVQNMDRKQNVGPGMMLMGQDPEIEKKELEKKLSATMKERRRKQLQSQDAQELSDTPGSGFSRRQYSSEEPSVPHSRSRKNDYEEDDFIVDDEEDDEYGNDDVDEDEEEDILDDEEDDEDERNAERLRNVKRDGESAYDNKDDKESEPVKRRKIAIEDDEEE